MAINVPHETHEQHVAGIVLSVFVSLAPDELTLQEAIVACERDPSVPDDEREIRQALKELTDDGLLREHEGCFIATRAAIQADALSF